MTTSIDREPSQGGEAEQYRTGSGHRGLVWAAAILASVGAVVAGVYGVNSGALILKVLAVEAAVVALAAWLTLHAGRIRQRIAEAHEWESQAWDELAGDEEEIALHEAQRARTIHYTVLAAPATILLGLVAGFLLLSRAGGDAGIVPDEAAPAASVICLVACCLWLVLSKSFAAADKDDLPEAPALMLAFREMQWATLLVAGGILGTMIWPEDGFWGYAEPWSPPGIWVARLILVWLVAICLEQLVRLIVAGLRRDSVEEGFVSPTYLLAREAIFVRGNPIASMFETIEARFGVSFRSSWAIRFVRGAALPSLVAVLLLFWGLTCLSVVGTSQWGVRESFGRVQAAPLPPGLHWKLPWPFGRVLHYPVKEVFTVPVGFEPASTRQRAFLWTNVHAAEEHPLLLGDGNEAVVIGALVYYKISEHYDEDDRISGDPEDARGFLAYVYRWSWRRPKGADQPPRAEAEEALRAYAYRALIEKTRDRTLEEVLSLNRAEFADGLKQRLREMSEQNRLGLDVVDVALITIHPPIEAAAEYLDVISAEIDKNRYGIEAEGARDIAIQDAQTDSYSIEALAKVRATEQVGRATEESAQFLALGQAYSSAPETFTLRLWYTTFARALGQMPPRPEPEEADQERSEASERPQKPKQLIVVDKTFADGPGKVILDLRPKAQRGNLVPGGVR